MLSAVTLFEITSVQKNTTDNPPQTYRLNKYLALAGAAPSRRSADELITAKLIKVNGSICTDFSFKVTPGVDQVLHDNRKIELKTSLHYVLLNKPSNAITTRSDERGRPTVFDHINYPYAPELKPVGRLDRNTTGLLLLTNDGDLINLLTHPSNEITKIYQVTCDQKFTEADIETLMSGADLEDGPFTPDEVVLLENRNQVGIQIHSGKNRIIRRYFEHLGFPLKKLDRVFFAGLTKYNLPRGKTRILSPKELRHVKSQVKSKPLPKT